MRILARVSRANHWPLTTFFHMASPREPNLIQAYLQWWKDHRKQKGFFSTLWRLRGVLWEFVRDSTPGRRRQRYGDVQYDWDYRVNTTSATVSWQNRLLGMFHSPYQPTEPALFHEMMSALKIDFREFTFIDLGSGKGRVLLMAANYPFHRTMGIELLPELHRVAQENLSQYKSSSQQCFAVECILGDAREFTFPSEPTVLYLFNPLPEEGLAHVIASLDRSLREQPRPLYVLYHNPLLDHVLANWGRLRKLSGTHQYRVYGNAAGVK
jgi:SAM-dependent methyltransferase